MEKIEREKNKTSPYKKTDKSFKLDNFQMEQHQNSQHSGYKIHQKIIE
ncbi:MAG: hypothetical protein GXO70_10195 [Acidobacteria bacterium]|nr:hypothetical protein [Acidobacteriota bacterium]